MSKKDRSEEILRDIRKVNLRVDTFIEEVKYNIKSTQKEINEREKLRENKKDI